MNRGHALLAAALTHRGRLVRWGLVGGGLVLWSTARIADAWEAASWLDHAWLSTSAATMTLLTLTLSCALLGGWALGTFGAYAPRQVQGVVVRAHELSALFPSLVLVGLIRIGDKQAGLLAIAFALGALKALHVARTTQLITTQMRKAPYTVAASQLGLSRVDAYRRHVGPRVVARLQSLLPDLAAQTLALDGALEFVGLGTADRCSWGGELGKALGRLPPDWQRVAAGTVGVAMALAVVAYFVKPGRRFQGENGAPQASRFFRSPRRLS